jgi:ABC-2 type transport system ATP-binding protein
VIPSVRSPKPAGRDGATQARSLSTPGIEVRGLTKIFRQGRRTVAARLRRLPDSRTECAAVRGIDLQVARGEVLVVLGPNGAGKTTTLKMLSTLMTPTSGEIFICGIDALRDPAQARRHLGVALGGERSVYWKLTARENLAYYAALQRIPRAGTGALVDQALREVGLADRADEYVERFSTGMKQRLVIARALLAEPVVVLLDEPTAGLDAHAAAYVRELVGQMRDSGRTILLATHHMDEAEELADRVAVIDHGELIALDKPAVLKQRIEARRTMAAEFRLDDSLSPDRLLRELGEEMEVVESELVGATLRVVVHDGRASPLPRLFAVAGRHGASLARADTKDPSLGDVFFALTGSGRRE